MFRNKLKLNPEKTEFILIGSRNNRKQLLPHFPINILGNQVSQAQSVKNLDITPQLKNFIGSQSGTGYNLK